MSDPALWTATAAITSVGLLFVTGAYAWLTYRMTRAIERQAWEASRPRILVAARTNQGGQFLLLHIENVGVSPAHDLHLEIDRPVHRHFGTQEAINDLPLFLDGLRSMPPATPSRFGLGVAFSYLSKEADRSMFPSSFNVLARYSHRGRLIEDHFPIDLNEQYLGSTVEREHMDEFGKSFPEVFRRSIREVVSAIEALNPEVGLEDGEE